MRRLPLSTLAFFATICGLPLVQAGLELSRGEAVQALEVVGPIEASRLRAFEDDLHDASFVHRDLVPHYQRALFALFGRGNEKALVGRDGWLYYATHRGSSRSAIGSSKRTARNCGMAVRRAPFAANTSPVWSSNWAALTPAR